MPPDIFDNWKLFGRKSSKGYHVPLDRLEKRKIRQKRSLSVLKNRLTLVNFVPMTMFDFSQEKETLDELP